jgi:hypothetical protein
MRCNIIQNMAHVFADNPNTVLLWLEDVKVIINIRQGVLQYG